MFFKNLTLTIMKKKKILFIGGSLNQTTIMYKIYEHLKSDYDCYFSPYYGDGYIKFLVDRGFLKFSILNGKFRQQTEEFLRYHELQIDYRGLADDYDLVFTCSDLIIPNNIKNKKVIHVQEGMTDPETLGYYLTKYFGFPRWMASTAATGLSNEYDLFCVASEGYKEFFSKKGADPEKIVVTGTPNFDNAKQFLNNDFSHKNYVMVATSDSRETYKLENRKRFILDAVKIANGKQLLFKLHPNEKFERAKKEIEKYAPGSLIYQQGNTNHMIANCDVLVAKYSSVVYIGLALGKEIHSYFKLSDLKKLMPIQNNGTSAERIAVIGKQLLESPQIKTAGIKKDYAVKQVLNH